MPSRPPGGALIGLVGLTAFAAAVAWFGIVRPQGNATPAAFPPAVAPAAEAPAPRAEQETRRSAEQAAEPVAESVESGSREARTLEQGKGPLLAQAPQETGRAVAQAPETGKPAGPSFDVVRIEPNGESVIAGRGAPGATIEMLRNGRSHARALADTSGLFAFVPPVLAPGSHEIGLTSIAPDGTRAQSQESVTVVISDDRARKPLVTLTSPDRPTVVLSAPDGPEAKKPSLAETPAGAGAVASTADPSPSPSALAGAQPVPPRPGVKIASVEAEEGGRLFVSGAAAAGATIRLYLNDSFIAPGGVGGDGKVSFAIGRGVRPGEYRVRLDDVDPVSGSVKSRAEVAFNMPAPLTVPLPPQAEPLDQTLAGSKSGQKEPTLSGQMPPMPAVPPDGRVATAPALPVDPALAPAPRLKAPDDGPVTSPGPSPQGAVGSPRPLEPGTVMVPQITTATVSRGDNLWRISRRVYGEGTRFTVIYDANQAQIRNPDRIYPGQIFVLPAGPEPEGAPREP